jgi:hypothetical protein
VKYLGIELCLAKKIIISFSTSKVALSVLLDIPVDMPKA